MLIGFLTFQKFHRKPKGSIGSSTIRVDNMIKYWKEAEIFKYGRNYDVMVYQKVYWIEHAKAFKGKKILDLCDADFMHWGYKTVEMASYCDAIVTSTKALAMTLARFIDKPIWVIPDRVDLNNYPYKKKHTKKAKKVGWFGYSHNFFVINESGIIKGLVDLKEDLEFVVISNNLFTPPAFVKDKVKITNIKWTPETVNKDIQSCDIIVNPRLNTAHWQYKSNNKTLHSWALGVPVAQNMKELKRFIDPTERTKEIKQRSLTKWDIQLSLKEYKLCINSL